MINYLRSAVFLMVVFGLFTAGCDAPLTEPAESFSSYQPKTQAGRTVQKLTEIHIRFAGEAIETASAYTDTGLTARSSARGVLEPRDLFQGLSGNETRMAAGRGGSLQVRTLRDELDALERRKNRELTANAPEVHELHSSPAIHPDIDSSSIIIGDQLIDGRTIAGAAAIEILKARLRGENIGDIVKDLDALSAGGVHPGRGFYLDNTRRWPGGVIHYKLTDGMSAELIRDFRKIAGEWSRKTHVRFVESNTYWGRISAAFFGGAMVNVTELPADARSNSTIGADKGSFSRIQLKSGAKLNTIRHEIGHSIGLKHEHQRPDRDEYITGDFTLDSGNNKIIREIFYRLEVTWRKAPVHSRGLRMQVAAPVVRWVEDTHIRKSKQYDYFSVMHYRWPKVNLPFRALKSQTAVIDINGVPTSRTVNPGDQLHKIAKQYISPLDIEAVNSMYKSQGAE